MNILFTLCGRAGSKGVKGKNARDFLNIPLVWYSMAGITLYIERYKKDEDTIDIVCNTDSDDLIKLVESVSFLKVVSLRRDESLAGDKVPKTAVIFDSLKRAEVLFNRHYDMVVDLDITSPLRKVEDIANAINRKIKRKEVNVVYSVVPSRRNPYFNMVKKEGGYFVDAFPSLLATRQEAPIFYDMNASIYVYNTEALKTKNLRTLFNENCDAIVMQDTGVLDIDSEEDYELMQVIANYLYNKVDGLKEIYQKVLSWRENETIYN